MSDVVVPALVAGLFALLGAFIGAALTRRTEYERWLRQERTSAFGVLLQEVHRARLYASTAYYDELGTEIEKSTRVTEAFARLGSYEGNARLFMSESGREELSEVLNKLWINCTPTGGPVNRTNQIKELLDRLQRLLEEELNYLPWKIRWPFK